MATTMSNIPNIIGVIGELYPSNTMVFALPFTFSSVVHCVPVTTATSLSNKRDYPTLFRTGSTVALQAAAMVDLVSSWNVSSVAVLVSNEEFGGNFGAALADRARLFGIQVSLVQTYTTEGLDYSNELRNMNATGARVFLIQADMFSAQTILESAKNISMLTSSYAYVLNNEYDQDIVYASNLYYNTTKTSGQEKNSPLDLSGVFQVTSSTPWNSDEAINLTQTWESLFHPNTTRGLNTKCPSFNYSSPDYVPPPAAARGCINGTDIWGGYLNEFYKLLNYRTPKLQPYVYDSHQCLKSIAKMIDHNLKRVSFQDLQQYGLVNSSISISATINSSNLKGWDSEFDVVFDENADKKADQFIINYQYNADFGLALPVLVGVWAANASMNPNASINMLPSASYQFIGGATSAPQMAVAPTVKVALNMPLRYGFIGVIALCSFVTLGLLVYMLWNRSIKVFQTSSPLFLSLIILGANVSYAGAFALATNPSAFTW